MMKADRDFNQAMANRDMDRFLSFRLREGPCFDSAAAPGREGP